MKDDKKSKKIYELIMYLIKEYIIMGIIFLIVYSIEKNYCEKIDFNSASRIVMFIMLVYFLISFGNGFRLNVNNKKEEGYILNKSFNKFGTVFWSMIFGYAYTYLFNGILLLITQGDYVLNFMPHVLEVLILWGLGMWAFYKWREFKNMELKIPESNSSTIKENSLSYFKETAYNQVSLAKDTNIVDKIQCPKCNHKFDVNVAHIVVGQKFTFKCPKCNLEMIKKRTEEVVETGLSNNAVSDSTKVSQDILLKQEQRDSNSKEVQERNFLELQVLELQKLQAQNNHKLVSQEQERIQLQQIHEQQIRELQQVQEKQLRELQQLQNQQVKELQEIQN